MTVSIRRLSGSAAVVMASIAVAAPVTTVAQGELFHQGDIGRAAQIDTSSGFSWPKTVSFGEKLFVGGSMSFLTMAGCAVIRAARRKTANPSELS